jgi:hypothetical protein
VLLLFPSPVRVNSRLVLVGDGVKIPKRGKKMPHHLKFAQPKALGRKVSDEFTVPVCRDHHHELHRHGNEAAWWANLNIAPLNVAKELWQTSPIHGSPQSVIANPQPSGVD